MSDSPEHIEVAIIGAGPAGLMAAERLVANGIKPVLFDAMPTPARKFLMAGKSGLNLTHSEDIAAFLARYGAAQGYLEPALRDFSPEAIRHWADSLGAETFVGSSGRVFPKTFKASPLLRAWLTRLLKQGATLRIRHRWIGWNEQNALVFETQTNQKTITADAVLLALGGNSWPKLGSTGAWRQHLEKRGICIHPFKPANCGFLVQWSDHFKERFAGAPIKNCVLSAAKGAASKGDFVISEDGIEGSAVYALSASLRDQIETEGTATLLIDLTPDRSFEQLLDSLAKNRRKRSFSTHLKKATGLAGAKANLLRECLPPETFADPRLLASAIKALPVTLTACRPIEEAISVAGGIAFKELNEDLMVKKLPGIFACGEMLDWEAPTGGYLLTACFAQGRQAANGVTAFLATER